MARPRHLPFWSSGILADNQTGWVGRADGEGGRTRSGAGRRHVRLIRNHFIRYGDTGLGRMALTYDGRDQVIAHDMDGAIC